MPCKGLSRIQNSGDRIQNKLSAFDSTGNNKMYRCEATSSYSDFWLLAPEFYVSTMLPLKVLSKGKQKSDPFDRDNLHMVEELK
jgi:hypothetical protein